MDAIVYTTQTGSTKAYADFLSQQIGIPAYSLKMAKKTVPAMSNILYLGWIMASTVKGYADAAKRYKVCAVCGVGMGETGTQSDIVREKTRIPASVPVFTLQGDFHVDKLRGIYRPMMKLMIKTVGKQLAEKPERTPEEEDMLDMMLHGGNRVKLEYADTVLNWYRSQP